MPPKPYEIARAWQSVTDEWIVRRNKAHDDGRQWEVVHHWGGTTIGPDTQKVIGRYPDRFTASEYADYCENEARAIAVLKLIETDR
jgi:hypothetical protein